VLEAFRIGYPGQQELPFEEDSDDD
jgi:hypothetical protein